MTKFLKISGLFAFLFVIGSAFTFVKGEVKEVQILTSAQCDMCKEKIEHHLKFEKGVKSVSLDVESKIATISFDDSKNDVTSLRKAISKLGYAADDVAADKKAYAKLAACCQLPMEKKAGCCSGGAAKCSKDKKPDSEPGAAVEPVKKGCCAGAGAKKCGTVKEQ